MNTMTRHTSQDIFEELESAVQSYARNFPCVFDHASGAEIRDVDGRRYIDFLAGAGTLNYGHNHPVLKRALIDYIERDGITHGLDLHTRAKEAFLTALRDIVLAPRGLDYRVQFTGPTGTNAVEAALKIARKVTGRTNIISFTNGFHGVSMGAVAATGNEHHRGGAGMPLGGATAMPYEGYFGSGMDTLEYLEKALDDPSSGLDEPAAVIVETVQGEGGLNAASVPWLRRLSTLCRERGILLIVDDIQAGCGRTGTFFSFEPAGIRPDIVTLSKSLSGYGLPFAIVLLRPDLDQWKPGEHNDTFRGNNHAFVTATATLEHFWRTREFADSVVTRGRFVERRLNELMRRFPNELVEVRGRGMFRGVRCADPEQAAEVCARAFELGLVIERSGPEDEVIKCLAPLTIEPTVLAEGLDMLEQAMADVFPAPLRKAS
ncbi:MAG: diaminobutyrate--2-oxoglutarate transaminase [Phycisphaerales bacterium]|nr:diaminobutyrate--2-oxoglutarate transaminase [Phycisphaerales bacterium]